jgi:hypothetical protein
VRPPSPHPSRKVRILSEFLIESFEKDGHLWGAETDAATAGSAFRDTV